MIILDTHVFVWLGLDNKKISRKALKEIQSDDLAVVDISFLEIASLVKKGRLKIPCTTSEFIQLTCDAHDITTLPITPEIAETAMAFGDHVNRDPADRVISAAAVINRAKLVTKDQNLRKAKEIPTCW